MAERIFWRLLTGVEAVVYGPPALVSSWFRDDRGHVSHDPLATDPPIAAAEFVR